MTQWQVFGTKLTTKSKFWTLSPSACAIAISYKDTMFLAVAWMFLPGWQSFGICLAVQYQFRFQKYGKWDPLGSRSNIDLEWRTGITLWLDDLCFHDKARYVTSRMVARQEAGNSIPALRGSLLYKLPQNVSAGMLPSVSNKWFHSNPTQSHPKILAPFPFQTSKMDLQVTFHMVL